MRLLANSFEPNELNQKVGLNESQAFCFSNQVAEQYPSLSQGYGLYLDFRPESDGWGKKAEMKMSTILDLRRFLTHSDPSPAPVKKEEDTEAEGAKVKVEDETGRVEDVKVEDAGEEPEKKKLKLEEPTEEDVKPDLNVTEGNGGQVVPEEKDEFDALLDDDDGIDFAAIEGI